MNQAELIAAVAGNTGLSKTQVGDVLTGLGVEVRDQINKGGEVTLPGIGRIYVKTRAARTGVNPRTREKIQIPAKKVPEFSAAGVLKAAAAG